jgi:DHA1 family tetracycline resistance protein-like MFS transporter
MADPKPHSKNALIFVLITVIINSIGFGIIIPVLPDLLKELTGLANSEAIIHGVWLTFVFALMQFFCMPIIGAMSDRYGRRPIMLLSLFGLSLDYFLMGFAPTIAFLYAGRMIAGALGATFSTANAYIADISPPETRAQNFGLVGAMFGVGLMLGPVIGGLLGEYGPRIPFIAAGIISMLNVIYGFFFLPETLTPENRRPFEWSRANPFGAVKSLARIRGVKGLIFVVFVLAMAHTVYPSTYTFTMNEALGWGPKEVGWSLGAFGVASIIVQGGLIRIIMPMTGLFWATMIGILAAIIAYAGFGVANAGWLVYVMGIFSAFAGLYGPALNNMMSTRINKSEQGELQGAIGAAQGLALMIGPLMMGYTFNHFGGASSDPYLPGAPFLLASLMSLIALMVFILTTTKEDRTRALPKDESPDLDNQDTSLTGQS